MMSAAAVAAAEVTEGGLYMWGSNSYGTLGDGTTTSRSSPVQIGSDTTWTDLYGGSSFTIATKTDGTLWSWGYANAYRTGLDTNETNYSSPVQINDATDWSGASLSGGEMGGGGVKEDGTLWIWGRAPPNGEPGTYESVPVQVGSLTDWKKLATGKRGAHAVKTDGTLWVWGVSDDGVQGLGDDAEPLYSPVQVGSLTDWKHVGRSRTHDLVMATKTDGTLWGWSINTNGVLGQGNTTTYSSPVQVGSLTDWDTVECGELTMYALKTDGTIWACGRAANGRFDKLAPSP